MIDDVLKTLKKLADENMSQQYEINLAANFLDKYLPIRMQHHLS
jgi:hypothetical protein